MKRGKRLTRNQKECLSAHGLNCDDWLFVEETDFCYVFVNKTTFVRKRVDKFRRNKR